MLSFAASRFPVQSSPAAHRRRPAAARQVMPPSAGRAPCACGGECPHCRTEKAQPKLTISEPGDPFEREADRVADAVLAGTSVPYLRQAPSKPQRKHRGESVSTAPDPARSFSAGAETAAAASGGAPLPADVHAYFGPRFGWDFTDVRVHTGAAASAAALAINARAFTVGHDIGFAPGEYAPATPQGRRLIAHELAHVVQQASSPSMAFRVMRTPYPGCTLATTGILDADFRVDRARDEARSMLRAARGAFQRMSSRTIRLVDRHFHCPSISQIHVIMDTLALAEVLLPTFDVRCAAAASAVCQRPFMMGGVADDGVLEFCPHAFSPVMTEFRLAGTFIMAAAGGGADPHMIRTPSYDDFTVPASAMVRNGYSYMWFAIELAGHRVRQPPTIPCAPLNTGTNVYVPPGAVADPSLIRPVTRFEPRPHGSVILPVFTDRAGKRFIYHDALPGARQYLPGERSRYYLPSEGEE
jgi:hypothetical protein